MTDSLPDEKVHECKEVFQLFDEDQDGAITTKELGYVLRALGLNPTQSELQEMVNEVDQDGSGKIELKEFLELYAEKAKSPPDTEEDLVEALKIFDKEGFGRVAAGELKYVLTQIAEKLSEKEVNQLLAEANIDGDGFVNLAELAHTMTYKY
jgi:calmodulin